MIRRYPSWNSYNPNDKSETKLDAKKKVKSKHNYFEYENTCVILPNIT